jgi:hypothetical protein
MNNDDQIAEFVDRVEECWIRLGLKSTERRRLVNELVDDLTSAQSTGATADDLVRADVVAFAVEVAEANGHQLASRRGRPAVGALISTAMIGGAVGAISSWYLVYTNYGLYNLLEQAFPEFIAVALLHVMAATLGFGGMAAAIWLRYRHQPRVISIAARTAAWAVVGGLVGLAPAIALATHMNYRWDSDVVLLESFLIGACIAAAIALGHRLRPLTRPNQPRP